MAVYLYEAQDINGIELKGKMECNDEFSLYTILREKGFFLINWKRKKAIKIKKPIKKISKKDLSIFCKQLSTIIDCGINITEALQLLCLQSINPVLKDNLLSIRKEVEKGESLADSFEEYKDKYPFIMINMIRVGEEGGNLDKVFNSLSDYFDRENKISKKIKTALAYPILLLVVTIIITLVLLLKIIPSFAITLNSMGQKIPKLTAYIIYISLFLRCNFIKILLLIVLLNVAVCIFIKKPKVKAKIDIFLLKVPFISKIYVKYIENRFILCMSILMESGNTVFNSIQLAKLCTENSVINNQVAKSIEEIMKGKSTLDALKEIEIIDPIVLSMIAVGEDTGKLPEMLKKSSEIIDEELTISIDKITSLLGPIMIIFLAVIIGLLIFSVMMPIFNIMDNIK